MKTNSIANEATVLIASIKQAAKTMTSYDMIKEYSLKGKLDEYNLCTQDINIERQRMIDEMGLKIYEVNRYKPEDDR